MGFYWENMFAAYIVGGLSVVHNGCAKDKKKWGGDIVKSVDLNETWMVLIGVKWKDSEAEMAPQAVLSSAFIMELEREKGIVSGLESS